MARTVANEPAGPSVVLHQLLVDHFNLEEIQELCFLLGVRYEDLGGQTLSARVLALQAYLERRNQLDKLIAEVKRLRPLVEWPVLGAPSPGDTPPYLGLQHFTEDDADWFFGRDALALELASCLKDHPFLAVTGASGSGKSSLVRAGVIPLVRQGAIIPGSAPSGDWQVHVITPGEAPLKTLAATLTRSSESVTAMKTLLEDLTADSQSLDLWSYRHLMERPGARLLLVVDQFEELFTQCDDPQERRMYVENLTRAVQNEMQGRVSLIIVLRADYYAPALEFEALRPLLETHQKIIGAMSSDDLRLAIEGPAESGGWIFQPGLVDLILRDIGASEGQRPAAGSLPLLSHALLETWKRREGRTLTLAGYQAAGGVHRAIAATADRVYAGLDAAHQSIARRLFLRLVKVERGSDDVRRRARLSELAGQNGDADESREVLQRLVDSRLVTVTGETAEVAHEALLREWPLLIRWLDEDREILRIQRQLTEAVESWVELEKDPGALYRGLRLAQAEAMAEEHGEDLSPLEQQFIAESRAALMAEKLARQRERQRARRVLVFGMLGGALGFSFTYLVGSIPEIENRSLLLFLAFLRMVAGGLAGFFLIFFVDLAESAAGRKPWPAWLPAGLSGAGVFALLLTFDSLLRSSQNSIAGREVSLLFAALAGGLWGIPAGLGRHRMLTERRARFRTLLLTSFTAGLLVMVANLAEPLLGNTSVIAGFIYGAAVPLGILLSVQLVEPLEEE